MNSLTTIRMVFSCWLALTAPRTGHPSLTHRTRRTAAHRDHPSVRPGPDRRRVADELVGAAAGALRRFGPMIEPDEKDWTWVLQQRCPECGFDAAACRAVDVAGLVRENAAVWRNLHADGAIRAGRPDPQTWSSLEYACHVRD